MLLNSLIFLLLSNAITSRRDKSILYSRVSISILLISALTSYDNLSLLFLAKEQFKIIEYSLIILFIITGSVFLISTSDIISIFLSIELQSYGLYLLSTIYRDSEPATSGGLMYFLLGGLSSCFILLSTALLYPPKDKCALELNWALHNPPKPHAFTSLYLESNILYTIVNHIAIVIRRDLKRLIIHYIANILLSKSKKYKLCIVLQGIISKFNDLFTLYFKITYLFISIFSFIVKVRYPLVYNIYLSLRNDYVYIIKGDLKLKHIQLFIALGFFLGNVDYFYWVVVMVLSSRMKSYIYIRGLDIQYPNLARFLYYLLDIIYSLSLTICTGYIANTIILPLINKLIIYLKNIFSGILYMWGGDKGNMGVEGSDRKNPIPEPEKPTDIGFSKTENKKGKYKKNLEEDYSFKKNYNNFFKALERVSEYGKYGNRKFNLPSILDKYREYLPQEDKIELNDLLNKPASKKDFDDKTTVKEFWGKRLEVHTDNWKDREKIINIFYKNSKSIQLDHLGGKNSQKSKDFKNELQVFYDKTRDDYKFKKSVILEQIRKKDGFEEQLRSFDSSICKTYNNYFKNL